VNYMGITLIVNIIGSVILERAPIAVE
jgi:hypothetical protein